MSLWLLAALVLIGLVFLTLDMVALPGVLLGICGVIFIFVGIWQTYSLYGALAGNIMLIASILVYIALLVFFMKSKTWNIFSLHEEIQGKVNTFDEDVIVPGALGESISRLAPSGKAKFGNQIVEVRTVAEFLDPGIKIEVLSVEATSIIVRACKPNNSSEK